MFRGHPNCFNHSSSSSGRKIVRHFFSSNLRVYIKEEDSKLAVDSYLPFLLFLVGLFLISSVDQPCCAYYITSVNVVRPRIVRPTHSIFPNQTCVASDLLDKLKPVTHHLQTVYSMFTDSHQGKKAGLKTVLKHECTTLTLFKIKRNTTKSAHVEECFVLNLANTRVVQIAHIHKAAAL